MVEVGRFDTRADAEFARSLLAAAGIPCVLAPNEAAGAYLLVRVNVDEEAGLSGRYGVLSLPTVILFAGGEARATVHGAQPRARFEREFSPYL